VEKEFGKVVRLKPIRSKGRIFSSLSKNIFSFCALTFCVHRTTLFSAHHGDKMAEEELRGILFFHSETGTEGGYWAFQDEKYIQHDVPRGYCKKCGLWLRKQTGTVRVERVIPLNEENIESVMKTCKLVEPPICSEGEHEEEIGDQWSYEGMHVLKDGDYLTIYDKNDPTKIVWQGTIKLKQYNCFTELTFGFWIHSDQVGVERETWARWFLGEGYHSASFIPFEKDKNIKPVN
jgi:hypothetical protein